MTTEEELLAVEKEGWEALSTGGDAEHRVVQLTDDSAVLAYRTRAVRNGVEYLALVTSTFVREQGEWRLAVHQQTPV